MWSLFHSAAPWALNVPSAAVLCFSSIAMLFLLHSAHSPHWLTLFIILKGGLAFSCSGGDESLILRLELLNCSIHFGLEDLHESIELRLILLLLHSKLNLPLL